MIESIASAGAPASKDEAALRRTCMQLEGVFMQELMKAMRATIPDGGMSGGAAEEMFTGMLDQHVADAASERLSSGLASALYRQLRARLDAQAP